MALRGTLSFINTTAATNTGAITISSGWTGSTPSVGDIIVMDFGIDKTSAAPSITGATFSAIASAADMNVVGADGTCSFGVRSRVWDGTETTMQLATAGSHFYSVTLRAYSGRSATPFTVTPAVSGPNALVSNPATLSITGLTANAGDDLVLFVGVNQSAGSGDVYTFTAPSGYANKVTQFGTSTVANQTTQSSCDNVGVSAGSTGTLTGTLGSSGEGVAYGAYLISLAATPTNLITAAVGVFALTGENAALGISGVSAAVGTFSLTGEGANMASTGVPLIMLAAPGVFNYLGASSITNYGLDPAVGIFSLVGEIATFGGSGIGGVIAAQQGAFSVQGFTAALVFAGLSGGSISASAGGFNLTGQVALLTVSNLPPSSSGVLGRPGGRTIFSTKKVSEQIDFIWDFISSLGPSETILQATLSAFTYAGNDTTPASILGGPAVVYGTQVYQLILGGLTGQIYGVTCSITTSLGQVITMSAYLAIEPNLP